jgi:hypothetical protein
MRLPSIYPQLPHFHIHGVVTSIPSKEKFEVCLSPQIFSKSQNKETELKKKRYWKKERERKELQKVSHNKGTNIFREDKNIPTLNLFAWVHSLSLSILTLSLNWFEKFCDPFGSIP